MTMRYEHEWSDAVVVSNLAIGLSPDHLLLGFTSAAACTSSYIASPTLGLYILRNRTTSQGPNGQEAFGHEPTPTL